MPPKPKPKKHRIRVTQVWVEVAYQVAERRITQQHIEVAEQATGTDRIQRVTQLWVDVAYTLPVQPFPDQLDPEYTTWSPAYIQPPVESEAGITAGLAGLHGLRVVLGKPAGYIQLDRQ